MKALRNSSAVMLIVATAIILNAQAADKPQDASKPAAEAFWTPFPSPTGGAVKVVIDGPAGTLFAASGNGIFKSSDGGKTWKATVASGLTDKGVLSLIYLPSTKTLLAGTHTGAFASTDDGASWVQAKGLPNLFGEFLPIFSFCTTSDGTIYAGTGGGVSKSSDGVSWSDAGKSMSGKTILAVAACDKTVYAGSTSPGNGGGPGGDVFKTTDGGATWTPSNPSAGSYKGLRDQVYSVRVLWTDPAAPGTLYAGSLRSQYPKLVPAGVYRSTDGGATWANLLPGESCLSICKSGKSILAAGEKLYSSSDGEKFAPVSIPTDNLLNAVCPTSAGVFLCSNGVYRSTDGLTDWAASSNGINALQQVGSAVITTSGDIYVKASPEGMLRSKDGGLHWSPVSTGLSSKAGKLWLNSHGEVMLTVGPLIYWLDSKDIWNKVDLGIKSPSIQAVCVSRGGPIYVGDMMGNVFRSDDPGHHGHSFVSLGKMPKAGIIFSICEDPKGDGKVFYSGTESNGAMKSVDACLTWTELGNPAKGNGYCVTLTPTGDLLLGKGSNNGVWVYKQATKEWAAASGIRQGDSVYSFFHCTATNQILCSGDRGVYVCGDGKNPPDGLNWTDCSSGLPHFNRTYMGAVRPTPTCFDAAGYMYVGINGEGHGLFKSIKPLRSKSDAANP